jgi:magnesium-transporting ATPase (P-type)
MGRIVAALRQAGHVTGCIGDGINDATALRLADIGLSVEGAADVARDAADMILTLPDQGVVLKGVDDGRCAFANTLKYLRIATAASFGNMILMAAASVVLPFLPLTAGQILLNNLWSDIPMLALAGARVDPKARDHPHRLVHRIAGVRASVQPRRSARSDGSGPVAPRPQLPSHWAVSRCPCRRSGRCVPFRSATCCRPT